MPEGDVSTGEVGTTGGGPCAGGLHAPATARAATVPNTSAARDRPDGWATGLATVTDSVTPQNGHEGSDTRTCRAHAAQGYKAIVSIRPTVSGFRKARRGPGAPADVTLDVGARHTPANCFSTSFL